MEKREALFAQARSAEAFAELVQPFSGMVYRHCLQMVGIDDAEDAAQEAMLRAFRAMPRFLGKSSVSTWLFRIAHNVCLDRLKKPARKRESVSLEGLREAGYEPASAGETPEDLYLRKANTAGLRYAISEISMMEQTLLNLYYGESMSYAELARLTGLREGTVKSKLSRAKERIRKRLGNQNSSFE